MKSIYEFFYYRILCILLGCICIILGIISPSIIVSMLKNTCRGLEEQE